MKKFWLLPILCIVSTAATAQQWMQVHHRHLGQDWVLPFQVDSTYFDISGDTFRSHLWNKDGQEMLVPLALDAVDSIDFAPTLPDEQKGHNKYQCFTMHITTDNLQPILQKEVWLPCHIAIDGKGEYSNYSGTGRIRGRGNSTWEWYAKKPYKFKLDAKSKLLGLDKAKDWNLLANYRDVTDMMNALAFETARLMNMPHTNHTRFVEVFLNGDYIGLYQLTEKIEVDDNRVDIDQQEGILFSLDADDGPSLSPYNGDNCWSEVFRLPLCVKYPDEPSAAQVQAVRSDFAVLERAIQEGNYVLADSLMDMDSYIHMLQLHEYLYNVELDAPRSMYVYRDKGGKFTFGPVWDWDAGFDFDWATMTTGHRFFSDWRELILGTDPQRGTGAAYSINRFFLCLFASQQFVQRYKELWNAVSPQLLQQPWQAVSQWVEHLNQGPYQREANRWPLQGMSTATELTKMANWLQQRRTYLDQVVNNYPDGSNVPTRIEVVSTINKTVNISYRNGYQQSGAINIDATMLKNTLGCSSTSQLTLVPLNANGQEGQNTAAGTFGAWFDADGNTCNWSEGHTFIEANNLSTWSYGCHPDNCQSGHSHSVKMQYRYTTGGVTKAMNVNIHFAIGK